MPEVLGVNYSGVIASRDCNVTGDYSPLPDAFRVLKRLKQERFEKIFLVSRASPQLQEKVMSWLLHQKFYQETGISFDNINFCLDRKDKVDICLEKGINHFIDDRAENLSYLFQETLIRDLLLFQAREDEMGRYRILLPAFQQVASWKEVERTLLD